VVRTNLTPFPYVPFLPLSFLPLFIKLENGSYSAFEGFLLLLDVAGSSLFHVPVLMKHIVVVHANWTSGRESSATVGAVA
jgi:hypothetical protein